MVSEKTPKTFQVLTASGTPEGEQYLRMGKFAKGIDKINVRFMKWRKISLPNENVYEWQ